MYYLCIRNQTLKTMGELFRADNIVTYNDWAGVETRNPLASFIDFTQVKPLRHCRKLYGFYAIFLKDFKCGDLRYGRRYYDYQKGTLLFVAPGQVFGADDDGREFQPQGYLLMFHPDLLRHTSLGKGIKEYTFFSYDSNEALHISSEERKIVMDCLGKIDYELTHPVDKHSRGLIVDGIKTLLDYCNRFYDRQFITRENQNSNILAQFESLLEDYFSSGEAERSGLPTVQYCASKLCLSSNYFNDLLRRETGNTALKTIHAKIIDLTKTRLVSSADTVSEIAYSLGFRYPQHLTRLFRNEEGCTPIEYRRQCQ